MVRAGWWIFAAVLLAQLCAAQDMTPPATVTAGSEVSIPTNGSGHATFYLVGPGSTAKQTVNLGEPVVLRAEDVSAAGKYVALLCTGACRSAHFVVTPAAVSALTFLAHPSRTPVGQNDAVSGVAFTLDKFHNLVTAPVNVNFRLSAGQADLVSRSATTKNGVAWFRTNSGNRAGMAQLTASVNNLSVRRVLQLVASEPCNLRIKAQRTAKGILVETDPVRDCAGNMLPDGTIVSFSASSSNGKSTVDTPIKQGVARAQITASGPTVISAASGVTMGNELRVGQ